MLITTHGIVLRETNYKDADKILTILTPDLGKQTVKARGCRRRNSKLTGVSELLVFSELTLFERQERYNLNEGFPVAQFWSLREEIVLLSLASYFAELTETVTQESLANPELLSHLLNALYALDTLKKPPELVKPAFELKLAALIGYEPLLDCCAICGAEEPVDPQLNLSRGVLHCTACRERIGGGISMPLTPSALQAARFLLADDGKHLYSFTLTPESLQRLADTAEAFLLTQLERGFHTLDYYKRIVMPME